MQEGDGLLAGDTGEYGGSDFHPSARNFGSIGIAQKVDFLLMKGCTGK